ncbi:hypothetical protein BCR34DRAFT_556078 [Clohesyomyces aquaticus]|uniref:Zn(2)-C6 fungal-type domain-containing protein n=1 Tax=Clohesyomyces aquaticus TaxID=1231657 RepID=A0A1Y2A3N4_9PLEO|nr:hypothetical protein BCR34DRAFT_556078 [Clohesyomyces aquaticus]
MPRRTPGFISKRPHQKSKRGCLTCKRKKVKCDEVAQPGCGYCTLRKLECIFPHDINTPPSSDSSGTPSDSVSTHASVSQSGSIIETHPLEDFSSVPLTTPRWLIPAAFSSIGQLSKVDLEYLHHYKTVAWKSITIREEEDIHQINRDMIPQVGMTHSYLLYAIMGISAAQIHLYTPSPENEKQLVYYRHKTLTSYNKSIQKITTDNYESLLLTSMLLQVLVPEPDLHADDSELLNTVAVFLTITQGLRILAALKWSCGIERLPCSRLFRRELRTLPPPPPVKKGVGIDENVAQVRTDNSFGNTPEYPNPPSTYGESQPDYENLPFRPRELMKAPFAKPMYWEIPAPAFLPPSLMALLHTLVEPPPQDPSEPLDFHLPVLLPMLHALSPIFLSLYYFHLSSDFYVRTVVFPTFMPPEFIALVKAREPRAMVIIAWWFAFVRLVPNMWWMRNLIPRLLQAVSNQIFRCNSKVLMDAVDGAFRIVRLTEKRGREVGAKGVFQGWDGLSWEDWGDGSSETDAVRDVLRNEVC